MRVDSPGWTRSQNGRIDFLKRKVDKSKINQIRQYSTSLSFCVTLSLISECCHVCVVVCGLWGSKSYCWNPTDTRMGLDQKGILEGLVCTGSVLQTEKNL